VQKGEKSGKKKQLQVACGEWGRPIW